MQTTPATSLMKSILIIKLLTKEAVSIMQVAPLDILKILKRIRILVRLIKPKRVEKEAIQTQLIPLSDLKECFRSNLIKSRNIGLKQLVSTLSLPKDTLQNQHSRTQVQDQSISQCKDPHMKTKLMSSLQIS